MFKFHKGECISLKIDNTALGLVAGDIRQTRRR